MRFGFEIYVQEDILGIRLWNWFKTIAFIKPNYDRDPWHSWGVCYSDRALHLRWGNKTKIFWMPWDYGSNIRNEVLTVKGTWSPASNVLEGIARKALIKAGVDRQDLWSLKIPDNREMHEADYSYTLKSGEIQKRKAKFYVEEREWRWRLFHPFAIGPKIVSKSISIEFDDEVGERTGSWKGGTIGCGYEMKPGETPLQSLRRMEAERKF